MPDDALAAIHRELNAFARRIRGNVTRLHPDLSFVAYTVLAHVQASGTCRAADLVAYYGLDKSTVSRQVTELERRGLLEPAPPAPGARGQQLQVSPEGRERLARAAARQRQALEERVAGWSPHDLAAFADYLRRFNAAGGRDG